MKVFPVVHINTPEVAVVQAKSALDFGADGVYLIDHNGSADTVFDTLEQLRSERPDSYAGVNLLGYSALGAVRKLQERMEFGVHEVPSALWIDDIRDYRGYPAELPKQIKDSDPHLHSLRILGGVAFKYTRTFTENPDLAAQEVRMLYNATDVVTTSGSGTGTAPSVVKIQAMKIASGDKPLAVASGISLENIDKYDSIVDEVLVASSVETSPYSGVFDSKKLKAFIRKAHRLA